MNFIAVHKSSNHVQTNDARAFLSFFWDHICKFNNCQKPYFLNDFNSITIAKTRLLVLNVLLEKCHFIYNTMSFTLFKYSSRVQMLIGGTIDPCNLTQCISFTFHFIFTQRLHFSTGDPNYSWCKIWAFGGLWSSPSAHWRQTAQCPHEGKQHNALTNDEVASL